MTLSPRMLVISSVQLFSLPEVFFRLNELVNDPRSTIKDICRVLETDTALTARLLKIVNSPLYGFTSRIDTISRAVTIVGTHELRDLALATSVTKAFAGLPAGLLTMDDFWRHSLYAAVVARALARQRRLLNPERFFVAGLLHDVGSLILFRKVPELARAALARVQGTTLLLWEAEQQVMGFDHARVGAELLSTWKLPASLCEAVAFHHAPLEAPTAPLEATIVHLANGIANLRGRAKSPLIPPPQLDARTWEAIGLSPEEVMDAVIADAEQQLEHMHGLIFGDG